MSLRNRSLRHLALALPALLSCPGAAWAVEPGIDIAAPRVAISTVDATLSFHPARLTLEQGDYVRWSALASSLHTTTSGAGCVADALWDASLATAGTSFTRAFPEPPQDFPYFCRNHCTLGMVGLVTLTTPIVLTMNDTSGTPRLSWTGGGGSYQVYRSDTPQFTGPNTAKLTPDGGGAGTTLTDLVSPQPDLGRANFYLVMNLF
jgi:plastocyanin